MKKYQVGLNPMQYYSQRGKPIYRIVQRMKVGSEEEDFRKISLDDIVTARREFDTLRARLDVPTHLVAEDINDHVFGKLKQRRVILLVEGKFVGREDLKSIIGIDLGVKPYQLHQRNLPNNTTRDAYVTVTEIHKYLEQEKEELLVNGFYGFLISASRFFYFQDSDLDKFRKNGEIDMVALIPLVASMPLHEGKSYMGLTAVRSPTEEQYKHDTPRFTSYRLKKSVADKLIDKLAMKDIKQEDIISDIAAHRIIVDSAEEAYKFDAFLKTSPRIGQSDITHILTKDYYKISEDPYNGLKVVVDVTRRESKRVIQAVIRGIQIVDKMSYFTNEIDPNSPVQRRKYELKKAMSRKAQKIREHYGKTLNDIFGTPEILVRIET